MRAVREPREEGGAIRPAIEEETLSGTRLAAPPLPVHPALVGLVHALRAAALARLVVEVAKDLVATAAEARRIGARGVPREARLGARDELDAHRAPALEREVGEAQSVAELGTRRAENRLEAEPASGEDGIAHDPVLRPDLRCIHGRARHGPMGEPG